MNEISMEKIGKQTYDQSLLLSFLSLFMDICYKVYPLTRVAKTCIRLYSGMVRFYYLYVSNAINNWNCDIHKNEVGHIQNFFRSSRCHIISLHSTPLGMESYLIASIQVWQVALVYIVQVARNDPDLTKLVCRNFFLDRWPE